MGNRAKGKSGASGNKNNRTKVRSSRNTPRGVKTVGSKSSRKSGGWNPFK